MSGRGRQHQPQPQENFGARSKLEDILKTLIDKADDTSKSPELELSPVIKTELDLESEPIESSPQAKRGVYRSRKKRKRELPMSHVDSDLIGGNKLQHSYVMKLFDRSVDLAQFEAKTSLYPVCREWMINRPVGQRVSRDRSPSPEPLEGSDDNSNGQHNIYRLPRPSKLGSYVREECGQDPRVPLPMPSAVNLDIHVDSSDAPSKDELLKANIDRWKMIRKAWKSSAQYNQARYNESYVILKGMYERQ